jgi:hypothetical protein
MGDERVHLVEELAANAWPAPVVQSQATGGRPLPDDHGGRPRRP